MGASTEHIVTFLHATIEELKLSIKAMNRLVISCDHRTSGDLKVNPRMCFGHMRAKDLLPQRAALSLTG
jgi:hypothetical protein